MIHWHKFVYRTKQFMVNVRHLLNQMLYKMTFSRLHLKTFYTSGIYRKQKEYNHTAYFTLSFYLHILWRWLHYSFCIQYSTFFILSTGKSEHNKYSMWVPILHSGVVQDMATIQMRWVFGQGLGIVHFTFDTISKSKLILF